MEVEEGCERSRWDSVSRRCRAMSLATSSAAVVEVVVVVVEVGLGRGVVDEGGLEDWCRRLVGDLMVMIESGGCRKV